MAKKKESTFFNMVSTLVLITLVAGLSLAGVYNATKGPIEKSKNEKKQNAIRMVLPEFDNIITFRIMPETGKDSLEFNLAFKGEDTVGVAIETYTDNGFSGRIRAMIGILHDGSLSDVVHLEHKETPGLGDKIEKSKSKWSDQFIGIEASAFPLSVSKDGGIIDAMTAATITSRAYCDAINRAEQAYKTWRN